MNDSKGTNVSRKILSPTSNGVGQDIRDLRTSNPSNTFIRAVVVKVLMDPSALDNDAILALKPTLQNPNYIDKAPRNSIIVRIVANGQDRKLNSSVICYPFLPSHMAVPIKAGEQVWVLFENPELGGNLPYWLWKTSEPMHVEDVNYTHADRKFDRTLQVKTSDKISKKQKTTSFPNGADTENSFTLRDKDDYEKIINEDESYRSFTPEAVPRFTKRPGDFVLQGSNNTLIVLGEDRADVPDKDGPTPQSGAIDLVVGRGRFPADVDQVPLNTSPRITQNTRGNIETDKNPGTSGTQNNPIEGNPDFKNDAARIYTSMKSNADELLQISDMLPKSFNDEMKPSGIAATIIAKSDNIRIIARRDSENGIDGSIAVIREGETNERSGLFLLPKGTVVVDGELIYIGREGGNGPGPGGSEPYIKFSKYKSQLETMISELTSLLQALATNFATPVAAPGMPHPGLAASIPTITSKITNLTTLKTKLDEAQSTRIFGN